jgi:hypothetical protein
MSIMEDMLNHLADMPGLTLPVYSLQFPEDEMSCVTLFPTGAGVGGNIGVGPGAFTNGSNVGYMDYPGIQIQVRYTDPYNAFKIAEDIRIWVNDNLPSGYLRCDANRSIPDGLTNQDDIDMLGGPCYRYSVDFSFIKVR